MRLCRCGAIVEKRCERCSPPSRHKETTAERGYDHRWKALSERKRRENPLCEECERDGMVTAATEAHHIVPIAEAPQLRLVWSNLMSVCSACHAKLDRQARRQGGNASTADGGGG